MPHVLTPISARFTRRLPTRQACAAGDSAPYERKNASLDDVVIVSALRTPLTKVGMGPKSGTMQS